MRVVYFDYWTKGLHNFKAIDSLLKQNGHETMLFHIGSWRYAHSKEETIDGILCRDISFYQTNNIFKVLEKIRPDVVVFLNCEHLVDRVIIQSCNTLNAKSVFLMHGIRATGEEINASIQIYSGHYNNIFNKIKKATKYFRLIIPNYFNIVWKVKKRDFLSLRPFKTVYSYFSNPAKSIFFPSNYVELIADRYLLYAKKYADHYFSLGVPRENLIVAGNPAYDELFSKIATNDFSTSSLPIDCMHPNASVKHFAIYLEDAFVEQGNLGGWDNQFRSKLIGEMASSLEKQGYFLVVKLHPKTELTAIDINHPNCLLLKQTNLFDLVYYSSFCIGHISTTINIAVLLEKPIVIPQWGSCKNIVDYFIKTNVGNPWLNPKDEVDLNINYEARTIFFEDSISYRGSNSILNIVNAII